jgi:hypothetical protein
MEKKNSGLVLMVIVIALSVASIYGMAASHVARASFFFLPICMALLQMLLHHLSQRPGWPHRFALIEDFFCIAAVFFFIAIGAAAISPIIRNATQARLERMMF